MTTDLIDRRPHFRDRLAAALRAYRDPNGAYLRGMVAGVRLDQAHRAGA